MKESLICYNCGKEIKQRENANILAFLGFVPRVFCNNCYSSKERGFLRHFLYVPKQPINSKIYFVGLWFLSLFIAPIWILIALFAEDSSPVWQIARIIMFVFIIFLVCWSWVLYYMAKQKLAKI